MEKYKYLYEEEKQRHEEALRRYKKDHMDEMEINNLYKKCNKKVRKVLHPKHYRMNLKMYQGPPMIQARSLKKLMEKRPLQRQEPHSLKNHQKPLTLLIQIQVTRTMNKGLPQKSLKKHQKRQTMNKNQQ